MSQKSSCAIAVVGIDIGKNSFHVVGQDRRELMESDVLAEQATNNSNEQFANSPDLANALLDAIMDAYAAHTTMSKQALDSNKVREGLKDILLGPAQLYEALRAKASPNRNAPP